MFVGQAGRESQRCDFQGLVKPDRMERPGQVNIIAVIEYAILPAGPEFVVRRVGDRSAIQSRKVVKRYADRAAFNGHGRRHPGGSIRRLPSPQDRVIDAGQVGGCFADAVFQAPIARQTCLGAG